MRGQVQPRPGRRPSPPSWPARPRRASPRGPGPPRPPGGRARHHQLAKVAAGSGAKLPGLKSSKHLLIKHTHMIPPGLVGKHGRRKKPSTETGGKSISHSRTPSPPNQDPLRTRAPARKLGALRTPTFKDERLIFRVRVWTILYLHINFNILASVHFTIV